MTRVEQLEKALRDVHAFALKCATDPRHTKQERMGARLVEVNLRTTMMVLGVNEDE